MAVAIQQTANMSEKKMKHEKVQGVWVVARSRRNRMQSYANQYESIRLCKYKIDLLANKVKIREEIIMDFFAWTNEPPTSCRPK